MTGQTAVGLLQSPHFDRAGSLRLRVAVVLNNLVVIVSILFVLSYVVTGRYELILYMVVPLLIPALIFRSLFRTARNSRMVIYYLGYMITMLGLLKLLSEPFYLVDLFFLPLYIGCFFLMLPYRVALAASIYSVLLFLGSGLVVHYFHPFPILYSNSNILSLQISYVSCVAIALMIYYWFARQSQQNSDLLGDAMLALHKMNDDNKLMISVISHDFRNYLSRVLLEVERYKQASSDIAHRQDLDRIEESMAKLSDLLDEVLQVRELFEDAGQDELTELAFKDVLRKIEMIFHLQMHAKRITLDTSKCQDIAVRVNPDVFIHVIMSNLIGNAVKFCPQEGRIELSSTVVDGRAIVTITNPAVDLQASNVRRISSGIGEVESKPGSNEERGQGQGIGIVRRFCDLYGIGFSIAANPASQTGRICVTATLSFESTAASR